MQATNQTAGMLPLPPCFRSGSTGRATHSLSLVPVSTVPLVSIMYVQCRAPFLAPMAAPRPRRASGAEARLQAFSASCFLQLCGTFCCAIFLWETQAWNLLQVL